MTQSNCAAAVLSFFMLFPVVAFSTSRTIAYQQQDVNENGWAVTKCTNCCGPTNCYLLTTGGKISLVVQRTKPNPVQWTLHVHDRLNQVALGKPELYGSSTVIIPSVLCPPFGEGPCFGGLFAVGTNGKKMWDLFPLGNSQPTVQALTMKGQTVLAVVSTNQPIDANGGKGNIVLLNMEGKVQHNITSIGPISSWRVSDTSNTFYVAVGSTVVEGGNNYVIAYSGVSGKELWRLSTSKIAKKSYFVVDHILVASYKKQDYVVLVGWGLVSVRSGSSGSMLWNDTTAGPHEHPSLLTHKDGTPFLLTACGNFQQIGLCSYNLISGTLQYKAPQSGTPDHYLYNWDELPQDTDIAFLSFISTKFGGNLTEIQTQTGKLGPNLGVGGSLPGSAWPPVLSNGNFVICTGGGVEAISMTTFKTSWFVNYTVCSGGAGQGTYGTADLISVGNCDDQEPTLITLNAKSGAIMDTTHFSPYSVRCEGIIPHDNNLYVTNWVTSVNHESISTTAVILLI